MIKLSEQKIQNSAGEKNIVRVSLNRPDVRNAFNPEMIEQLTKSFQSFASRTDIAAVVLSGEGKSFCAGADLAWMQDMVRYSLEQNQKDSEQLFEMFAAIWNCPSPVVGVVHGAAFGGALGLLACCDYVFAEEKTQFCFSEVKLGLAPAVISHFVVRKSPLAAVMPWMLSGQLLSVTDLKSANLVHQAYSMADDTQKNVEKYLENFIEAGVQAVRETKKLLRRMDGLSWEQSKKATTQVIAERRVSIEGQEGLKAFLEKRSPTWRKN